jgi:hypothetical protein
MPNLPTFSATPAAKNGSPETSLVAVLERIEQRLARLEGAVDQLDSIGRAAPGALATVTDTLDGVAAHLAESGVDVDQRMRTSLRLLERLTAPQAASAIETLLGSSMTDERAVGALGKVADALAAEADHEPAAVGPWAAFRALGDRDVQHALGFLLAIAKRLGASLAQPVPKELPPTSKQR